MKRIDAHQHFWKYNAQRDTWMQDLPALQRDFLPVDLSPLLAQHNIAGCIAVQADQSEEETHFLLQLAQEYPFIKGVVGWVDLQADNIAERLDYYAQFKQVKGFRHILQAEPNEKFMLNDKFVHGISLLQQHQFTYDILIYPHHLPYAQQLVAMFPEQPFVIDHLAKPLIKKGLMQPWQENIEKIAAYQNVYCKISGMVTEADWNNHSYNHFVPYLDVITTAFGTQRIMYGSDWPVCLLAASYSETCRIVEQYFSSFPENEQALFFGDNASRFYNL